MIPVNEPALRGKELEYVTECVTSGWVSSAGRFIEAFENAWAAYCGRAHGVSVSNGTVALHAALETLRLRPGDEVIIPSFTIVSCATAVIQAGGVPVLVDSDPRTWGMDPAAVEARITPHTRAIMPVHIYGHPVDMDPILEIAERHNLYVVEDAAEAHGTEYLSRRSGAWRRCGGMGTLSCFSFYANKVVTTGEGGMVLTDDPQLAERLRSVRNLAFRPGRRFFHEEIGYNYRMTNLQAALGLAQTERIDAIVETKRAMGRGYAARLKGIPGITLQAEEPWGRSNYWMYGLTLDESTGLDAAAFAARLATRGVETRPFFLGMHEQPAFHARGLFRGERYPVAERLARQGLYLPSGLTLTTEQMDQVAAAVAASVP